MPTERFTIIIMQHTILYSTLSHSTPSHSYKSSTNPIYISLNKIFASFERDANSKNSFAKPPKPDVPGSSWSFQQIEWLGVKWECKCDISEMFSRDSELQPNCVLRRYIVDSPKKPWEEIESGKDLDYTPLYAWLFCLAKKEEPIRSMIGLPRFRNQGLSPRLALPALFLHSRHDKGKNQVSLLGISDQPTINAYHPHSASKTTVSTAFLITSVLPTINYPIGQVRRHDES